MWNHLGLHLMFSKELSDLVRGGLETPGPREPAQWGWMSVSTDWPLVLTLELDNSMMDGGKEFSGSSLI